MTALEPGELILELEVPRPEASTYVKAMERNRFSFALVGVAAARNGGETRLALAGVAPIPWLLDGAGRARPGDAAAGHRVQGRPRAAARATRARSARLMIWAVVLAAGAASRFGSPKQALLLEPVLRARPPRAASTTCSSCSARTSSRRDARTVDCPDWERGPGASLRCGLAALPAEAEAAVVVLGDGPELDPAAIDRVIAAWRARERAGCAPPPTAARGSIRYCSRARLGRKFRTRAPRSSTPSSSPATIYPLQETSISPMRCPRD